MSNVPQIIPGAVLQASGEANKIKELKLTPKQGAFLKAYLDPESKTFGNGTLSAMATYDTDDYVTAASIATENLKKLQNPVKQLMEARGIGLDKLLITLNNGLQAKRIHTSFTEPDKQTPDYAIRHKYLETAGKWLGIDKQNEETGNVKRKIVATEFFES